jgi:uncharacterized protein YcbK (DUF882 family)
MQLTRDFSTDELECPCCKACRMNPGFMAALQILRDQWKKPILINSGFRCQEHNKAVQGVPSSQHLIGRAADCRITADDRYEFVKLALNVGFKGIGIAVNFVHIDTREGPEQLWKYSN